LADLGVEFIHCLTGKLETYLGSIALLAGQIALLLGLAISRQK
jgi:hypothetical protein